MPQVKYPLVNCLCVLPFWESIIWGRIPYDEVKVAPPYVTRPYSNYIPHHDKPRLILVEQWKKEQVWPILVVGTANSQTDAGRHQLYGSLVLFSIT